MLSSDLTARVCRVRQGLHLRQRRVGHPDHDDVVAIVPEPPYALVVASRVQVPQVQTLAAEQERSRRRVVQKCDSRLIVPVRSQVNVTLEIGMVTRLSILAGIVVITREVDLMVWVCTIDRCVML